MLLRSLSWFRRRILLRPSLWVALATFVAYWDETALHGKFVYDDGGSVSKNVVVNGQMGDQWMKELLRRDFWGTPMSEPQSHKSFRPITTFTFRLNWLWELRQEHHGKNEGEQKADPKQLPVVETTFSFHLVNLVLHCIVTALATEAAAFVFTAPPYETTPQLITGLIFGLHPVHVEAVTNITSRGELLMSLFFLTAFLVYASHIPKPNDIHQFSIHTTIGLYVVPWICMMLSVFSKEQGATTLMTCVAYDFIQNHFSVREYLNQLLRHRNVTAVAFLRRTLLLALQTLAVVAWRYWLNGETSPDFVFDQNPAAFSSDRFTRVCSVAWVYCLYIRDAVYPRYLGPDWSGLSIDLIRDWRDPRLVAVGALWSGSAMALSALLGVCGGPQYPCHTTRPPSVATQLRSQVGDVRRVSLVAFVAFLFLPFLLSSNLLVVVGLMKADRVIYLPLLGFAMLEALLFQTVFGSLPQILPANNNSSLRARLSVPSKYCAGLVLVLLQLLCFSVKLHERNFAWSDQLRLWLSSYQVNSRSHHTIYNAGYELSLKQRYAEAEQVLRPIASPRVEGPSNTFVYAMVLFNLGRCDVAQPLIDDALVVIEEKRQTGGPRNTESSLARVKSNMLVAQAFCSPDLTQSGKIMYDAVKADPSNQYAIDQAMQVVQRLEAIAKIH